jgi:hypothetical protein
LEHSSQRKEFGLRQITVTEDELDEIRPDSPRHEVFTEDPSRKKARIWISMSEIKELNELREATGGRPVKLREKTLQNQDFLTFAPWAERRHNLVEEMKAKGESTRTEKARKDLFLTENFMVEDDEGVMTTEDWEKLVGN